MVAACITLCNSACISCIWCFLLSICCPKIVRSIREAESSECCARKFKHRRLSTESLDAREIKRQREEKREFDIEKRRVNRYDEAFSPMGSRDPTNIIYQRSKEVALDPGEESLLRERYTSPDAAPESVKVDRNNRFIDLEDHKPFGDRLDRLRRSSGDQVGKYRLYAKLNRVTSSGSNERSLERKKRSVRESGGNKHDKCYHGCENQRFRCRRDANSYRSETRPQED